MVDPAIQMNSIPKLRKNYSVFRFIGGNLISFCGDQIYLLAIPLIVLSITGSPLSMGIVAALERLPILFQPLTGVLADRYNKKYLLLFCDLLRCIIVGIIGLLYIFGILDMWFLYTGAFTIGVLSQIYNTSQFASIPKMVRKSDLHSVNVINTGFFNTAVLVAPGIGGLIISLYNPGYALLINSMSFFIAFLTVLSINMNTSEDSKKFKRNSFWLDIKEGFQFVFHSKPILFTNLAMLVSVFGTTMFLTMMVFHLTGTISLSSEKVGLLISIGGIGAICGALITTKVRESFTYRSILFFASLIGGLSIVLFGLSTSYIWLIILNAVGTLASSMMNPCIVTIRQSLTPDHLLGRVQATSRFMTWISMPVAAFLAGILSNNIGTNLTIILGGITSTVASFLYLHHSLGK